MFSIKTKQALLTALKHNAHNKKKQSSTKAHVSVLGVHFQLSHPHVRAKLILTQELSVAQKTKL